MRMTFLLGASALVLAACGDTTDTAETNTDGGELEAASWSYEGDTGPENWGALSEDNAVCDTGGEQSPIDLSRDATTEGEAGSLEINWASGALMVENTGYNSNIVAPEGGSITLDGETYNFVQAHFHTPSEYTLDGEQMAGDIHFVHANDAGDLAVIGVFFTEGAENETLASAMSAFSGNEGDVTVEDATLDPTAMLPADRSFFRFAGSLTTPPCSEGVRWVFMANPVEVSAEQIAAHREMFGSTARPIQATNDRSITYVGG